MSWVLTVEGQPPSVKHSYHIVKFGKRAGLAKLPQVEAYQLIVKAAAERAKPPGWQPRGEDVRVEFWFHLAQWVDTDNALSAISDALQWGTGVDDRRFLPCVVERTIGWMRPWVHVRVDHDHG